MSRTVKRIDVPPGALQSQQLKNVAWQVFQYQYFSGIIVRATPYDVPFYGTALALMLKNFQRPVVLFTKEEQVEEASRWAELGQRGVFALGDDGLDLACRTTYTEEGRLCSPHYPQVGRIQGREYRFSSKLLPLEEKDPFLMCDALNERITVLYPGDSLTSREELLETSGVLICLRSEEETEWLFGEEMPQLLRLHRRGIPVVVTGLPGQFQEPRLRRLFLMSGVISAGDMTREGAMIKLMWTLARTRSVDGVRLYFGLSFGGEVTQQ